MAFVGLVLTAGAQVNAADSVMQHANGNKFSIGGYGEVALSRNFYSDNTKRYVNASEHKDDPSHGRFDIPHAVIYLGYDFGRGWTLGTEIEFEHTGTGSAIENEADEAAEWEREQEKARREAEVEQRKLAQEQQRFAKLVSTNEGAEEMVEEEEKKFSEKAEKLKKIAKEAVKDTAISAGKAHYMETHWKDAAASTNEDTTSFGQRVSAFKQSAPGQAKDFAKGVGDYVVGAAISAGANLAANRAGYYGAKAKYALDDRMQSWRNATLEKARAKAEREKLQLAEKQYREQQRLEQKQAKEAQKAGTSL